MIKEGLIVKIIGKKQTVKIIRSFNRFMRKLTAKSYALQLNIEWNIKPIPEWFDHYIDHYYQWHQRRNPMWLERGCFNLLAIKENSNLLELCCGDGFNAYHFYSIRARNIIAVDFDKDAIAHAKKNNQANNINYQMSDIRINLPDDKFDNIVWDAAIEHFTKKEIIKLMEKIKNRLNNNGILSGYTIIEENTDPGHPQHEIRFTSKEDLLSFFVPHFKNIKIFETIHPNRKNLYFFASDSILPFDDDWPFQTIHKIN